MPGLTIGNFISLLIPAVIISIIPLGIINFIAGISENKFATSNAGMIIINGGGVLLITFLLYLGTYTPWKNQNTETTNQIENQIEVVTPPVSSYSIEKKVEKHIEKDGLKSDGKIHVYLVGSGETVQAKKSSSIKSMTYYEESDHLIINFNGKEYVFANVSSSLWKSFKEASSSDAFYDSHFKGNKSYWINDYNGKNGDKIVMEHVSSTAQSYSSSDYGYSRSSSKSIESEYAECKDCGRIYSKDEMWELGGYYICENCVEDGEYIWDEGSGELYYEDDYWDMMHEREFGY